MPSPQSLVTFLVMLASLLLVLRTQIVLKSEYALGVSLVLALLVAWFVDTRIPPDEEVSEEDDLIEDTDEPAAQERQDTT